MFKNLKVKFKNSTCRPIPETNVFKTKYGRRTFSCAGPKLWNVLSLNVKAEENIKSFKKLVKTIIVGTDKFI